MRVDAHKNRKVAIIPSFLIIGKVSFRFLFSLIWFSSLKVLRANVPFLEVNFVLTARRESIEAGGKSHAARAFTGRNCLDRSTHGPRNVVVGSSFYP